MDRAQKAIEQEALKKRFEEDETLIVTHYAGLTVAEMTELRNNLREEGASFKVTKNTLARLALQGTKFEGIADMFSGPVGIASSTDVVAPAKVVQKFAKDHKNLIIIGGSMGETRLDASGVEALAKMPSLDELRSKIIGVIQAPATKVAGVLQAPAGQLARVCAAYAEKGA